MKISGFTFVKNATKLYFPIKESILSVLPLVDEFVIALGDNDTDDNTREEILSLNSDKIKIIDTTWQLEKFQKNTEYARQTDIAKNACTGDWLFYLQSDEAIHENDLQTIKVACEKHLANEAVEGFIFKYRHFWGDFNHYHVSHGWYPREIRIIRNRPDIHSWRDAQSFRSYTQFTESTECYAGKDNTRKLNVVELDAYIYHYGWVRPPHLMNKKQKKMAASHNGKDLADEVIEVVEWDYGPLSLLPIFTGSHPSVMRDWISQFNWQDKIYNDKAASPAGRSLHKHEKTKYRIITFIEQNLFGGRELGGFKNYNKLKA